MTGRTDPLERVLENRLRKKVQLAGGMVVKMAPTISGIPDDLVLMPNGGMYLVELKKNGGKLRALQEHFQTRAGQLGTRVHVLTGAGEIDAWVVWATNRSIEAYRTPRSQTPKEAVR